MRIARLETFRVKPRWLFVKVHTDVGICGWGEASVPGRIRTVEAAVHELGRALTGADPLQIEAIWQQSYKGTFYRGGVILTSALSGVEQALWDIAGKALKAPVYQLLGGRVRDRVRMYGWLRGAATGDYVDRAAQDAEAKGFTAYKLVPVPAMRMIESPATFDKVVGEVARFREALGRGIDVAVDFHGRATPAVARQLIPLLEAFSPMFIEEPVLPGNLDALKELKEQTCIPIATGERLFTRWQFRDVVYRQAASIVQPDLANAGGILEVRKIAAMAEVEEIALAPHCPVGPIALAASLQVAACTPNFVCQEHLTLGEGYLKEPFVVKNGYIELSDGPGLGIQIDEERLQEKLMTSDWETPQFRLPDGSFSEW